MTQKNVQTRDPWKELATRKENQQVEIGEILNGLAMEARAAQALKKALLERVTHLTQRQ